MEINLCEITKIMPYLKNPRHNDASVDAVARSLQEFGFRQPIVVDENFVVVCGHARLKAAQKLGLEKENRRLALRERQPAVGCMYPRVM